jgi:hypothetical protein
MVMSLRSIAFQLLMGLFLLAALDSPAMGAGDNEKGTGIRSGTGTIKYINLEGGFYGILADNGQKYLPGNLAKEYQVDGRRVTFRAKILTGVVTIQMWGTPVEVLSMESLK